MTCPVTPDTTVSVCAMPTRTYLQRVDELVRLHLLAMGYGPATFGQRRNLWAANSTNPGFTASVAVEHATAQSPDPSAPDQKLVGVAYGFPGPPGSWWYREVHRGLRSAGLSPQDATDILSDYDEISEVHVLPGHQGHGIGHLLMDDLLSRLRCGTSLLSTPEVDDGTNAAWSLYRSLGFRDLLRGFHFTSDPRPFGILARDRRTGTPSPRDCAGAADQRTASCPRPGP
ncbi:MAG: GNAT family N-acetyltransferase [Corynebacterium provencense]|nr:GNAT family N-acetyltransferase [Corynebacterium provencense]